MGFELTNLIWFCLIGICAGWLAGQIWKGSGFGLVVDLIIGIIGAILGGFVFHLLGLAWGGLLGSLIVATIGALLLLFIIKQLKRA